MGRQRRPAVSENYLLLFDEGEEQATSILIESEAWYHWLATEDNQSFTFRHALGTFTIRRERKRHANRSSCLHRWPCLTSSTFLLMKLF